MAPIKAVTFDFWQTLVEDSPRNLAKQRARRMDAIAAILRRAGCPLSARKVEAAYER
jgi:FMN phosphatase YigB (HAD superfamily)